MLPKAYIVHRIRSRTRLRIPGKCKDPDYFQSLRESLSRIPGLDDVVASYVSGSVLLQHSCTSFDSLLPELVALDQFELTDEKIPPLPPMEAVMGKITRTDALIGEVSSGNLDLRTLIFAGALLMTLQQVARGNLVGPALPTLMAALSMMNGGNGIFPGDGNVDSSQVVDGAGS